MIVGFFDLERSTGEMGTALFVKWDAVTAGDALELPFEPPPVGSSTF